jgi:hypothetical protein
MKEIKTEVEYEPRKRVIIHEYSQHKSPEDLVRYEFRGASQGANVGTLQWVAGILMRFIPMPLGSESAMRELLKGNLHWNYVSFAPMEKFQAEVYVEDMKVTCIVLDVSANPVFQAIGQFIRKRWSARRK